MRTLKEILEELIIKSHIESEISEPYKPDDYDRLQIEKAKQEILGLIPPKIDGTATDELPFGYWQKCEGHNEAKYYFYYGR